MTRPLIKLILVLLLGAMLNVSLAWALAIAHGTPTKIDRNRTQSPSTTDLRPDELQWLALTDWSPDGGDIGCLRHDFHAFGFQQWSYRSSYEPIDVVVVCGWPMRAFREEWQYRCLPPGRYIGAPSEMGVWRVPNFGRLIRSQGEPEKKLYLPVTPQWGGLIVNTGLYAALIWLALGGLRDWRRWQRRRRGQCRHCGYPIGASPVCTECGRPVSKSRRDA